MSLEINMSSGKKPHTQKYILYDYLHKIVKNSNQYVVAQSLLGTGGRGRSEHLGGDEYAHYVVMMVLWVYTYQNLSSCVS